MHIKRRALPLLLGAAFPARAARAAAPIRVGTLRFGSLAWELDVMRRHGLLVGFGLEVVDFAAGSASQVALQAGNVDLVLQDWLWVSRQRAAGANWTLAPIPSALGAIMAPPGSPVHGVADLRGRRLGIAGGPLDKSWLLLRLYASRKAAIDLDAAVEKTFGPPPLIAEQLRAGRLDAMLTYWPFAARADAQGLHPVLHIGDVLAALGAPRDLPMLGFVFDQDWAAHHRAALQAFLAASQVARSILLHSDAEWDAIAPLTRARGPAELAQLRDWYRSGFPGTWSPAAAQAAARLFALFAQVGGSALVGPSTQLTPGTFWGA
jgi:NitT/TauT family transport system substrate-binding protein